MRSIVKKQLNKENYNRKIRHKFEDVPALSITSLVDVLTILLVFLIQNVSMEGQKITMPNNMRFPVTMTKPDLQNESGTTVLQVYPNRILIGELGTEFGSLQDFRSNPKKRVELLSYLRYTASETLKNKDEYGNPITQTALLIQADRSIPCFYITELVKLGTSSSFDFIYFATLLDQEWLNRGNTAS